MYYGYNVPTGYKGLVRGKWILFATEEEYVEYVNELHFMEDISHESK